MTKEERQYIEQETDWLREFYDAYKEGLKNLSDPNYSRGVLRGIEEKLTPVLQYSPLTDPEHAAMFILGACQARMEKLLTQLHFLDDYEARRKDLHEFEAKFNAEPPSDESHSDQLETDGQL